MKTLLARAFALLVVLFLAKPVTVWGLTPATVVPAGKHVAVPDIAIEKAPSLELIEIIHYKRGFGHKPQHAPGGGGGAACYGFLARGAKLTATEELVYSEVNSGLPQAQVEAALGAASGEWDGQTATAVFGTLTYDGGANFDAAADGVNELSFGNYPTVGVIAVARVWGIFSGPPIGRYIDQFDIQFDTDFAWGDATLDATLMDLENIAVHEIGHGVGLADIYDSPCTEVTMYGYATEGETKKRSLEPQDITGLQSLYGGN